MVGLEGKYKYDFAVNGLFHAAGKQPRRPRLHTYSVEALASEVDLPWIQRGSAVWRQIAHGPAKIAK
jgi:hypothetical protein